MSVTVLPRNVRASLGAHTAARATESIAAALEEHAVGNVSSDARFDFTRLTLDEAAWHELADAVRALRHRAHHLHDSCANRGVGLPRSLTLLLYEAAPDRPEGGTPPHGSRTRHY